MAVQVKATVVLSDYWGPLSGTPPGSPIALQNPSMVGGGPLVAITKWPSINEPRRDLSLPVVVPYKSFV
jgi:hypothetical protein